MMKSKWLVVSLVLSIGVNLALVGFLIGRHGPPMPGMDPIRSYPQWARELPEQRRRDLRPLVHQHIVGVRPHLRSLRQQLGKLSEVLSAETLDTELLTSVLATIRNEQAQLQAASHASFSHFVSQLSTPERKQLAAKMREPRGPRHANRPGAPPGEPHP